MIYLVLPLKLCPHSSEVLCLTLRWSDVVHDVQLDVRQIDISTEVRVKLYVVEDSENM